MHSSWNTGSAHVFSVCHTHIFFFFFTHFLGLTQTTIKFVKVEQRFGMHARIILDGLVFVCLMIVAAIKRIEREKRCCLSLFKGGQKRVLCNKLPANIMYFTTYFPTPIATAASLDISIYPLLTCSTLKHVSIALIWCQTPNPMFNSNTIMMMSMLCVCTDQKFVPFN